MPRHVEAVFRRADGSNELHIENSKYPIKGVPRNSVLNEPLKAFKRMIFRVAITMGSKLAPFENHDKNLSPAMKEVCRVFDMIAWAEGKPRMKMFWQTMKRMVKWLDEDDAYRYRIQWFLGKLNMDKVRLDEGDTYYFRSKSFNLDLGEKDMPQDYKEQLIAQVKSFNEEVRKRNLDFDFEPDKEEKADEALKETKQENEQSQT